MLPRRWLWLSAFPVLVLFTVAAFALRAEPSPLGPDDIPPARATTYAPQKVVYHINQGGGWLGHDHAERLGNIRNHIAAVGADKIDLRVVLNSAGLKLLAAAKSDPELASRIDALKAKGVTFLICRNTMMGRSIPLRTLYGATADDIVPSGVAEVARLQQAGYILMKP